MKRLLVAAWLGLSVPAFGASDFQTGLHALRSGNYATALSSLTASAESGDPRAAQLLADMYANGRGVAPNPGLAFEWRQRAAALGDPGAQYVVGTQYLKGAGVPRDPRSAVLWLDRAAHQNHPNAQLELGFLYLDGDGVAKDPTQGLLWIRRAAEQGLLDAQQVLSHLYEKGATGMPRDAAAASQWAAAAKQNEEAGRQINQSIMQQQDAIAIARSFYYARPVGPWVAPVWGFGWSRYGGWNYGVSVGGWW